MLIQCRERDFQDFVVYSSQEELVQARQSLEDIVDRQFQNVRTPVTETIRERISVLDQAIAATC